MKQLLQAQFMNRNLLKVFSLTMSLFLWLYVFNTSKIVIEKDYEIKLIPPDGVGFTKEPLHKITFKIKGPRGFIRAIKEKEEKLNILINRESISGNTFSFRSEKYVPNFPFGVEVLDIKPKKVTQILAPLETRTLPIEVVTVGKVSTDFEYLGYELIQKTVEVTGPANLMQGRRSVRTKPFELNQLNGPKTISLEFEKSSNLLKTDKDMIDVQFVARPRKANTTIDLIPIRFLTSKRIISSSHKKVRIEALALDEFQRFDRDDIQIIADIPESSSGAMVVDLQAKLPDNLKLLKIVPSSIKVKIK